MQWTDEQRRAIDTRSTNILLSAAAGSGKTTVLVARVLDLIRSGESQIDRMLIVTFTRAASADMRAKLSRELGKLAAEGDERCRSQQLLLDRASISTLHGFCSDFLHTHFESAGVDPAFRILDDAEARRITDEALDQAVEEAYAAPDEELTALDYARGPKNVRAMAELLLHMLDERPNPEAWLAQVCSPDSSMRQAWIDEMVSAAHRDIDRALLLTRLALAHPECNGNYAPALEKDVAALRSLQRIREFSSLYNALRDFKQASPSRKKDAGPVGEAVKKLRLDAKSALDKIALRGIDLNIALQDIDSLLPELHALARITLNARALLEERKSELSALSYSDLEHRTLRALENEDTARELRERYDFIFVDEYQDTSDVQEALIGRICRKNNLFMVGDVKQSIYRFRQAEPRLFLKKYRRHRRNEGGTLLPLTMNFRSRPRILNFVNRIFEHAMYGNESEIVYDSLARLNHGNSALEGGEVNIHLLEAPESENADEALLDMKACEREALFIAGEIRRLMNEDPELHYRDFAILTRTKRGVLGRMAVVLTQQGIPAFADGSEAFYDSVEIALALSLLKLTANRRSDIELIGVLRSPIVGLSAEQLAQIRIAQPETPFVDAVESYSHGEDEIASQLRVFLEMLQSWRLLALCTDLGVLTRTIVDESGLYGCSGALSGGAQRQANLDQLVRNAAQFDQTISGALTRFLKHTEKLREQGDSDGAHLLGENDDVVRLMTVHKSKGLEFPVVFGAMLGRRYSNRTSSELLSAHRDLGLGCLYCDPKLQTRRKTLSQAAIAECTRREDKAEELRILYVLLTRARDRLALVGSVSSFSSAQARWNALRETPSAANSYLDVIMPALDETCGELYSLHLHDADTLSIAHGISAPIDLSEQSHVQADDSLLQALLWRYPDDKAARQPLKLTVSGLLRELQAPDMQEPLIERPSFMSENPDRMTAAERGTAYHRAMQCLDLSTLAALPAHARNAQITSQLDTLLAAGRIAPNQRQAVYPNRIARFLNGAIGERLLSASEVHREWPFNVRMRISEALEKDEAKDYGSEEILVQGVIDCCFMEDGCWVLLDYKTDRTDDAQALTLRYRNQLRLYALALERITGVQVKEICLCLLMTGETLNIPLNSSDDAPVPW